MRHAPDHGFLEEARYVGMDPVLDGFAGVLVEIRRRDATGSGGGEEYLLLETAAGSGNRLLRFASRSREHVYKLFGRELLPASDEGQGSGSEPHGQERGVET